jgi:two-component system, LuxR family, sensor kinase FixL
VTWDIPNNLPPVWADRHSVLQVLLNLTKNSERAVESAADKRISIGVVAHDGIVSIRVADTGPGIAAGDKLFQPFQKGAESTGLGLYLSRAFVRSFHGDLRHEATPSGCVFVIDLAAAGPYADGRPADAGRANHGTYTTFVA